MVWDTRGAPVQDYKMITQIENIPQNRDMYRNFFNFIVKF